MRAPLFYCWLAVFLLALRSWAQVTLPCPSNQVTCLGGSIISAPSCAADSTLCPKRAQCTTSAAPYRCADDSCVATPQSCPPLMQNKLLVCSPAPTITCWDGSCVSDASNCPLIQPCPNAYDQRCIDMSCQQDCSAVGTNINTYLNDPVLNSVFYCPNVPGFLCLNISGCALGDFRCPDGTCAPQKGWCVQPTGTSGNGINSNGCPSGQVRAFGQRFGVCLASSSNSTGPAFLSVQPFLGTIGSAAINFTLSDQTGVAFGSVAVPAFLTLGSTMDLVIDQYVDANYFYPLFYGTSCFKNPSTCNPILNLSIAGFKHPSWSPFQDLPAQSIWSAIFRMYSPQMGLLNANPPSAGTALELIIDGHYTVNVSMLTNVPLGLEYYACLARNSGNISEVTGTWACVDSYPVKVSNNLYTARIPLQMLVNNYHYAFIGDYSKQSRWPRAETIGGGALAIGVILAVVLGVILLSNREKMFSWISTNVFKTPS